MKFAKLAAIGLSLVLGASVAQAETAAKNIFHKYTQPSGGSSQAIGFYSNGCLQGGVNLPETGPTWQAMRLSRNRNWGHPILLAYLEELSVKARQDAGWAGLYLGDIGNPRGGPMPSGHASHQIGLDADIWMLPPQRLNLSREERENISSASVVTEDLKNLNSNWTEGHFRVLRHAASDPRVDRIFVTPMVKIAMCQMEGGDRSYLYKIRPWWGHNYHFHVRLKCPPGNPNCRTQDPIDASTDGCNWAKEFYGMYITQTIPVPPSPPAPEKPPLTLSSMPQQCAALVQ